MAKKNKTEFINREISWLSFNERVLQEAMDNSVPLIQRIRFLGIYANNLDEFYRVRVATLRRASGISKKPIDPMDFNPEATLAEIQQAVARQHEKFDKEFQNLLNEASRSGIQMSTHMNFRKEHVVFIREYFEANLKPYIVPVILQTKTPLPPFSDNRLHFAVELITKKRQSTNTFAVIEFPETPERIIRLPPVPGKKDYFIFIDDILRIHLEELFPNYSFDEAQAYSFKTIRDAELDIDDDLSKGILEKMTRSLNQRKRGQYVRIMYDKDLPQVMLDSILKKMKTRDAANITPGLRYQHLRDLMSFPVFDRTDLAYPKLKKLLHPSIKKDGSILNTIRKKDVMLHFPYHSFQYIIDFLREAAIDPDVRTIRITLYRVSPQSQIVSALINAARNGKRVVAVIELLARFDEENNIAVSKALQEAGVRVIPGVQGLKVHCKLIQISRKEGARTVRYVHIGTGNFHEKTAEVYSDISLFTARKEIGAEVRRLFEFFENNFQRSTHRHLILSPFSTRRKFLDLINHEIAIAEKGKPAWVTIKMNNLVDAGLIRKLYEANQAGVKVQIIIRGICSLIPDISSKHEKIKVVSVVGRFLEHSRIIAFGNGGKPIYYISSADWMVRNIDHRIEVSAPVYDESLKKDLQAILDIQLNENAKARIVEKSLKNEYLKSKTVRKQLDTQMQTYQYLASKKE